MISSKSKYILYILIITVSMMPMTAGCSRTPQDGKKSEGNVRETADETSKDSSGDDKDSEGIRKPLEEFGEYLKELAEEGRLDELEQYTESQYLTLDEMEEMASHGPALDHFKEYINYQYDSSAPTVIGADVNNDGCRDVIEYRPAVETGDLYQNSITIYKGDENGSYQVMYYQPHFEAGLSLLSTLSFVQFKEETFLVFLPNPHFINAEITVLYIKDEAVQGMLTLEKEREDLEGEVLYCWPEYREMAEGLSRNGMEYCTRNSADAVGSAEERIEKKDKESASYSEYRRTEKDCRNEELEIKAACLRKYRGMIRNQRLYYHGAAGFGRGYIGDIDNDGRNEIYLKQEVMLHLDLKTDRGDYIPFLTGELFGKHEGKRGLRYYMNKDKKQTGFKDLCGLDIYNSDMTLQMFWLERQDDENITLMRFMDDNGYENQIRGYLIKDGGYEQVLTVRLIPRIICNLSYEWREDQEDSGLTYTIHMRRTGGMRHTEIYGLADTNFQEEINNKMGVLLKESADQFILENKKNAFIWIGPISYAVRHASNERLVVTYLMYYYSYETYHHGYDEQVTIEADLVTGECTVVDKETEGSYKTEKDIGYYSW